MGPNGSGKSTLAQVLSGSEAFAVTAGSVTYEGRDLLDMAPEDRAREGVFMAFQYPVEIPGVNSAYFLRAGLNEIRKHRGEADMDAIDFLALIKEKLALVEMDESFLKTFCQRGILGRREETPRDSADGGARTEAVDHG